MEDYMLKIPSSVYKSIEEYHKLNDINIKLDNFIIILLNKGFRIEKYGTRPFQKEVDINNITDIQVNEDKKEEEVKKPKRTVRIIKHDSNKTKGKD